jgi:hypothetical protein
MNRIRTALLGVSVMFGSGAASGDVMVGEKTSTYLYGLSTTCSACGIEGGGLGMESDAGPYEDPVLIGGSREVLGIAFGVANPNQADIGLHASTGLYGGGATPPYVHAMADNSNDPIVGGIGTSSGASGRLQWYFAIVPKDPNPLAGGPISIDINFSMGAAASCAAQLASCNAEAHAYFRAAAPAILQTPPIEEALDVVFNVPGADFELLPPTTRTLSTYASASPIYWNGILIEARGSTSLLEGDASAEAFVDPTLDFADPADAADFDILVSSGIDPTAVPEADATLLGLVAVGSLLLRCRRGAPIRRIDSA